MNIKNFLAFKAFVSLAFGLTMVAIPTILAPIYGMHLSAQGAIFARWLGAMLLGIGLICWFARADAGALQKGVLLSLFVSDSIGFGVALAAQLQGLANDLGWSNVVIWFILAAGLGYFRFIKK